MSRIRFNATRAPGASGVFVCSDRFPDFTVRRWPGRPANENDTRGWRPDLDGHYARMLRGEIPSGTAPR